MDLIFQLNLILALLKEKNSPELWKKINELILEQNNYNTYLNLSNKIDLAKKSFISSIKVNNYNSFKELRKNIILFPPELTVKINDLELLYLIIYRSILILNYLNKNNLKLKLQNIVKNIENDKRRKEKKNDNIIFMFLGGLPDITDSHYNKFFNTTNDSFFIIVHPMKLDNYIDNHINTNDFYKKMYNNGRLLVVDNEHHVKTKWATFSLVSAVLLMIQYSLKEKGNIFKKFVLLSTNDKPLYNYKIIYNELNGDEKSWIYYSGENQGYARYFLKKPYKYQGGVFTTNDIVYVSQWMALDINHIEYFIDMSEPNYITYIKQGEVNCGGIMIDKIVAKNKDSIYSQYLSSFMGSYKDKMTFEELKNILDNGNCIGTDEYFFGSIIRYHTKDLKSNIKWLSIEELKKINLKQFIEPIDNEDFYLSEFKTVYPSNLSTGIYIDNYRTWYGGNPKFGNFEYRIQIIENSNPTDNSDKYFIIKNNDVLKLSPEQINELNSKGLEYYDTLKGGSNKHDDDLKNFIEFGNENTEYEDLNNIYTISSTYTDWTIVNTNPSNAFRDFDIKYFKLTKDVIREPLINLVEKLEPSELLNTIIKETDRTSEKVNDEFVKGPSYHPVEYLTYTFKSILNSYNLIVFLDLDNNDKTNYFNNDYFQIKEIYLNIINKNIDNLKLENHNKKTYYIFNDAISDKVKNTKYGHPVTSFSLNNALAYGALFIRKVMTDSNIELYTDKLLNLPNYVHNNYYEFQERSNKYIKQDSTIFVKESSDNFKQKYLKYKQKYLSVIKKNI